MRCAFSVLAACIAELGCSSTARADASRVQTGASLGYAFPAAALERGSRVSDLTYGLTVGGHEDPRVFGEVHR